MAFAVTSRISDTGATASATKTSASFTPAANSLLVVAATVQRENHTDAVSWTISDSVGLTWTARPVGGTADIAGNFGGDLTVWTAPIGGSPASMTVTVDPFTTLNTGWIGLSVFDITGHNVASPLAQAGATNTTTSTGNSVSLTVTLGSAPSSANLVVGIFTGQNDTTGAFASISGFTELQNPTGVNDHIGVWYRTGTTTAAVTCTDLGQSVNWGAAIALEVSTAGGGTAYDKTPADPVGVTDSATNVVDGVRSPADPVGVTDTAAPVAASSRAPADPVGVTDQVAVESGRAPADAVGVTDAATQVATVDRSAADPVAVTDSASRALDASRAPADAIGVTDSATAELGQLHTPADPVGVTDSVTVQIAADRSVADPIGATDTATPVLTPTGGAALLGTFALSSADPHSITITGATAGRDIWLVANTAAVVTTPAGWTSEASRVFTMASYVFRLAGTGNPGGSIGVTLDLSAARALSAVAVEAPTAAAGTIYASLVAPINGSGSTTWGTGAHTFPQRDDALAVYCFHSATTPPTFAAQSYDQGFTALADTGWAGTGGAGDEATRVMIGTATRVGFTAGGVVLTLDAAGPTGSAVGFLAFDLDTGMTRAPADAVGVTDSAAQVATTDRTPADAVGVTDSAAPAVAYVRTVADAVGVTDTDTPQTIDIGYDLADPVGATDAATRSVDAVRTPADPVGLTDAATANATGGTERTPAESVGITDSVATVVSSVLSVADPVGVTDAAPTAANVVRSAADLVGVTDVSSGLLGFEFTISDSIGVTDSAIRTLSAARSLSDALDVLDAAATTRTVFLALLEAVSASDGAAGLLDTGIRFDVEDCVVFVTLADLIGAVTVDTVHSVKRCCT